MASGCSMRGAHFYRRWASRATEVALMTTDGKARRRCVHSAGIWSMIADAIDTGNHNDLADLTHNLAVIPTIRVVR